MGLAERIDAVRCEPFRRVEKGGVEAAIGYLRNQQPGLVIFDVDYTIRRPGEGGLGEIPVEVMENLRSLRTLGWKLMFVTNQPKKGHQIARSLANNDRNGYYFFPDSLEKEFGEENVLGGGADFPVRHFKRTEKAIGLVAGRVREVLGGTRKVWMVGDREADEQFFERVVGVLSPFLKERAGFIRLPDSPMIAMAKKMPGLVRGMMVGLAERVMP